MALVFSTLLLPEALKASSGIPYYCSKRKGCKFFTRHNLIGKITVKCPKNLKKQLSPHYFCAIFLKKITKTERPLWFTGFLPGKKPILVYAKKTKSKISLRVLNSKVVLWTKSSFLYQKILVSKGFWRQKDLFFSADKPASDVQAFLDLYTELNKGVNCRYFSENLGFDLKRYFNLATNLLVGKIEEGGFHQWLSIEGEKQAIAYDPLADGLGKSLLFAHSPIPELNFLNYLKLFKLNADLGSKELVADRLR